MTAWRKVTTTVTALVMISLGTAGASAAAAPNLQDTDPQTVVVSGQEFGPEDGVEVITESYDVNPGEGPVGSIYEAAPTGISPLATWGSSYAISKETAQLYYKGRAKAAANVYSGKRIIKVCIWYSQGSVYVSGTVCSSASFTGSSWKVGSEKSVGQWDNLSVNWPQTTFRIQTTRINPSVH